jgi:hypothetical protein
MFLIDPKRSTTSLLSGHFDKVFHGIAVGYSYSSTIGQQNAFRMRFTPTRDADGNIAGGKGVLGLGAGGVTGLLQYKQLTGCIDKGGQ